MKVRETKTQKETNVERDIDGFLVEDDLEIEHDRDDISPAMRASEDVASENLETLANRYCNLARGTARIPTERQPRENVDGLNEETSGLLMFLLPTKVCYCYLDCTYTCS